MINLVRRVVTTVSAAFTLGAIVLLAPVVSDAQAASKSLVNLNPCNVSATSQPFARWLDFAEYELSPGGDFESSTWTLTGGARRVAGSEPYAATGRLGSYSLSLPAGSSGESPLTCVDAAYPSARFFIAGQGSVAVSIVDGSAVIPAGVAVAGGCWSPTPVMLTSAAVLGALSGGTAQVSVRVTGLTGDPRIDDVFIDPWRDG